MENLNLLCQTIRFQRTALQNSLAMITAVQQHGERFLKSTLDQTPWMPGEGKDACLFWAGLWRRNLTGVSELMDKNLATLERFTSTGERRDARPPAETLVEKAAERPAAEPAEQPQPATTARKAAQEKKTGGEKREGGEKEIAPPKEAEQKAMTATEAQQAPVVEPPEKKSEPSGKQPSEKKKPSEPKS